MRQPGSPAAPRPERLGGGAKTAQDCGNSSSRRNPAEKLMRIVVFGAGAVGGHLAARLAAEGPGVGIEVAAVARGAQLAAIRDRGLTLHIGDQRFSGKLRATDRPEELGHQNVVIVTLKSS